MDKTVHKAGAVYRSALVIFGWLVFVGSYFVIDPIMIIMMQMVARVLP